jgi:hypothetical protein
MFFEGTHVAPRLAIWLISIKSALLILLPQYWSLDAQAVAVPLFLRCTHRVDARGEHPIGDHGMEKRLWPNSSKTIKCVC